MSKTRTLDPQQSTFRTAVPATQRLQPLAYRVDDAAAIVGVSKSTVWRLIQEGRLPARKLDSLTVIRHEDLTAFLDGLPLVRQLVEPPMTLPPAPRPVPAAPASRKVVSKPEPPRPVQPADLKPTAKYLRGPLSPDKILRTPTTELAAMIGSHPIRRPDALAKLWDYIRAHGLQAEVDRRIILADANFKAAFGLDRVSMRDLNRLVKERLVPGWDAPG